MRLWSLHPQYLDRQGLLACWREGLLAQDVLLKLEARGKTQQPVEKGKIIQQKTIVIGYANHPQLIRFMGPDSIDRISFYLECIADEASRRSYEFQYEKIHHVGPLGHGQHLHVSLGQAKFEVQHLLAKLSSRKGQSRITLPRWNDEHVPELHPLFWYDYTNWEKADWEKGTITDTDDEEEVADA